MKSIEPSSISEINRTDVSKSGNSLSLSGNQIAEQSIHVGSENAVCTRNEPGGICKVASAFFVDNDLRCGIGASKVADPAGVI
jgi:hypothetical protein